VGYNTHGIHSILNNQLHKKLLDVTF